ncbi:MAG: HAD-IIA family hydrolase [Actinobacteria bacterium]|nr:MAG: HAD-IIA family hydrolase [Actinomycetota bacterium]
MALADRFDGFLLDLDGVVWIGREPVPGSAEALRALREEGKGIVFVTNNPGKPPAAYAERLRELGVEVAPEQVVTAGMVAARLAGDAADGGSALVIGAPALKEMVAATGATLLEGEAAWEADAVVVSGHRGFDYEELLAAKRALDAGAAFVATSRDPTMPYPGGELPGTGSVLAAVETATGRRAEIAGKPERHLFEMAIESLRGSFVRHERTKEPRNLKLAMVGDRVSSDIAGGHAAGLETILVLSGTTSREDAETADPAPDHVVDSLGDLLA